MQKIIILLSFFCATALYPTIDPDRPISRPPRELTQVEAYCKNISDFFVTEVLGYHALKPENEQKIRSIISQLKMDDYCIEIRGMSNAAKRIFGYTNAFVMPSVNRDPKEHSFMYVSEEWFETLADDAKQALIRHELMHLRYDHVRKNNKCAQIGVMVWFASFLLMKCIYEKYGPMNISQIKTDCPSCKEPLTIVTSKPYGFINFMLPLVLEIPLMVWLSKINRHFEKEADIEAAKTMSNKQGFATLFNNMKSYIDDPKSQFEIKPKLEAWFKPISDLFRSHPDLDERIEYTQNLA